MVPFLMLITSGELELRDLHAFDGKHLIAMNSGQPAKFYASSNGGIGWQETFHETNPKAFFDAFSFWDNQHGIGFSDPLRDHLLLVRTNNGGQNWQRVSQQQSPLTEKGEAGFAASGTCLATFGESLVWIGLGGTRSDNENARVVFSADRGSTWSSAVTPIRRGPSQGIFSLVFVSAKHGVAVGGDYKAPDEAVHNVAITRDGGLSWRMPSGKPPSGFRSVVTFYQHNNRITLVASGRNGTDVSHDLGENWKRVSDLGFQVAAFSADSKLGIGVGRDGMIGRWVE